MRCRPPTACAKLPPHAPERPPCARFRTVQKQRASKRPVGEPATIIDNPEASLRYRGGARAIPGSIWGYLGDAWLRGIELRLFSNDHSRRPMGRFMGAC